MRARYVVASVLLGAGLVGCSGTSGAQALPCRGQLPGPCLDGAEAPPVEEPVDCLGNGSSCVGTLNGTKGAVVVTNNTNPGEPWRLELTCSLGGERFSDTQLPSELPVGADTVCSYGAQALRWNVIQGTDPAPALAPRKVAPPCGGEKPGACPDGPHRGTPRARSQLITRDLSAPTTVFQRPRDPASLALDLAPVVPMDPARPARGSTTSQRSAP
jgi:hypothetical protein